MQYTADRGFWMRVRRMFDEAKDLSQGDQALYIESNCIDQPELRRKLESLLAAHRRAPSVLDESLPARILALTEEEAPIEVENLVGHILRDRYVVTSILNRGGSSVVYLARDWHLHGRLVVVKQIVLPPAQSARARELLETEVRSLSVITHPGVAVPLDSGLTPNGAPFLILQFIPGPTLRSLLERGPMHPRRACRLLEQLADALEAAHSHSILHLDLKPENVLVSNAGQDREQVVIVDFGISRTAAGGYGPTGAIGGSISYMAPETLIGTPCTASDQYALAVIASEMLTGVRPGSDAGRAALDALPGSAAAALHRAGFRQPDQRFATPSEFVRTLSDSWRRASPDAVAWVRWACVALVAALMFAGSVMAVKDMQQEQAKQSEVALLRTALAGLARYLKLEKVPDALALPVMEAHLSRFRRFRETSAHNAGELQSLAEELHDQAQHLGDPNYRNSGNLIIAEMILREAHMLAQEAVRRGDGKPEFMVTAARTATAHASLLADLGRFDELPLLVAQALPGTLEHFTARPDERELYGLRASLLIALSAVFVHEGEHRRALELRHEAASMQRRLYDEQPDDYHRRLSLAAALASRGRLYREMGDTDDARRDYRESMSIAEKTISIAGDNAPEWQVALNLTEFGQTCLMDENPALAIEPLAASAKQWRTLLAENKNDTASQRNLALSLSWLAVARSRVRTPKAQIAPIAREASELARVVARHAPPGSKPGKEVESIWRNVAEAGFPSGSHSALLD